MNIDLGVITSSYYLEISDQVIVLPSWELPPCTAIRDRFACRQLLLRQGQVTTFAGRCASREKQNDHRPIRGTVPRAIRGTGCRQFQLLDRSPGQVPPFTFTDTFLKGGNYKRKKGVQKLDPEKAQQIVESLGVVEVLYNGASVWIENLEGEDAEVRYLETGEIIQVPVSELVEGGSVEPEL